MLNQIGNLNLEEASAGDLSRAYQISFALFSARRLGLIGRNESIKLSELTNETGLEEESLSIFLGILIQLNIVERHGEMIRTNPPYNTEKIANLILFQESIAKLLLQYPENINKDLKTLDEKYQDQALLKSYMELMSSYSKGLLEEKVKFGLQQIKNTPKRILDLGCGPAEIGLTLFSSDDTIELFLLDRKEVIDLLKNKIGSRANSASLSLIEDDIISFETWPKSIDLVILSNVIHMFPVNLVEKIFSKIQEILNPNGHLLVVEVPQSNSELQISELSYLGTLQCLSGYTPSLWSKKQLLSYFIKSGFNLKWQTDHDDSDHSLFTTTAFLLQTKS